MSRLVEYCNITTDIQNVYTGIELFAKQTVNNGKFSTVSGEIYSRMGESGYVGQLSIDREVKTVAANLAAVSVATPWFYASNVLYILTSIIGTNDITIASDTWENIKETAREDASQELENYLYMYDSPLPFKKNSVKEYDRDIVRCCAYLTCARIIEMSNPEDMLAVRLRKNVVSYDDQGNLAGGIIHEYKTDNKKFSFEATTQKYNGNIIPISQTGAGMIELAGYSDASDAYEYVVTITTGGAVGTAQYSLTKNNVAIATRICYISYTHLHANVYLRFTNNEYTIGDSWKIQFDGRTNKQKEAGIGSILMTHGGRSSVYSDTDLC